jgi:hypothetical protein
VSRSESDNCAAILDASVVHNVQLAGAVLTHFMGCAVLSKTRARLRGLRRGQGVSPRDRSVVNR